MRTTSLLLAIVLAASAAAQSGRKGTAARSPVPTQPEIQPTIDSQPERAPAAPSELRSLPEDLLKRQLKALDKGSFSLADFGGKVIVVNVWASWCGPCRMEVPDYEKVRKEYDGRGVEFIALTTEDPRTSSERVRQFARDFNFGFRLGWADRETAFTLMNGRNSIPQTLVIAADGRVISHWRGYTRGQSRDRLRQTIESALAETPTPAKGFRWDP